MDTAQDRTVPAEPAASGGAPSRRLRLGVTLLLVLITVAVFARVAGFGFVWYDDPKEVASNPHMWAGFTADSLKWVFTGEGDYWDPVTRLVHMGVYRGFGQRAGYHHLANLIFHTGSVAVLLDFLTAATGAFWPSVFVALVFAVHPLQVEGVAWVTQLNGILATLFWFLSLRQWTAYARSGRRSRYLAAAGLFAVSLACKPLAVMMPFLLLILDLWPFGRRWTRSTLLEKLPFLLLAALASAATIAIQHPVIGASKHYPLGLRLENALQNYAIFAVQFFWPSGLNLIYPYPSSIPVARAVAAGAALAAVSLGVRAARRRYPWLVAGWLWFLAGLLPVIGIVQAGYRARTDHSMYVPILGPAIMLAWSLRERLSPRLALTAGCAAAAAMAAASAVQVSYWRDSEAVFRRALAVTRDNYAAWSDLGTSLLDQPGRMAESLAAFREAARIAPDDPDSHQSLGGALQIAGQSDEALKEFRTVLALKPESPLALAGIGVVLGRMPGHLEEGVASLRQALNFDPLNTYAQWKLGQLLWDHGQREEGLTWLEQAARGAAADSVELRYALGKALSTVPGRLSEAIENLEAAVRMVPAYVAGQEALALALQRDPARRAEALSHFETVVRLSPSSPQGRNNLAVALMEAGRYDEAQVQFREALRLQPDYAQAHIGLGALFEKLPGRTADALAEYETAFRLRPAPALESRIDRLRTEKP